MDPAIGHGGRDPAVVRGGVGWIRGSEHPAAHERQACDLSLVDNVKEGRLDARRRSRQLVEEQPGRATAREYRSDSFRPRGRRDGDLAVSDERLATDVGRLDLAADQRLDVRVALRRERTDRSGLSGSWCSPQEHREVHGKRGEDCLTDILFHVLERQVD